MVTTELPTSTSTTSSLPTTTTTTATTTTVAYDSESIDIGPLSLRGGHSVVWTGEEMIVWGGDTGDGGPYLADGAAYNPETDTWRMIAQAPLSPRGYHVAAWTGDEMLIVGGSGGSDGASYDPSSDTWAPIAQSPVPTRSTNEGTTGSVWTGDKLFVWSAADDLAAVYDPHRDEWTEIGPTGIDATYGSLRWTGHEVYAFGDNKQAYPDERELLGAVWTGEEWRHLPTTDLSTETQYEAADARFTAWTGDRFLAWSGSGEQAKTVSYTPGDESWVETTPVPIPPCEGQGEPTQAGDQVIAFGSCGSIAAFYDPAVDTWTTARVLGYPTARYTVWTGEQLLHWGGGCCPSVEAWAYTPNQ
ncbi:MAG: kelch repeat-containing protein [Acidimicrobiia bacterium]